MRGRRASGLVAGLLGAALLDVCLAQVPAPSTSSPAAKVVALSGQVSVLRDSVPWALEVGDAVQPRQLVVSGPDGFATFQLSDGSTFDVYPNSRVTFRDNPGNWQDLLRVWLGRIKVRIQRLNGQPNHNRVETPTAVISVRGTVFDVEVEGEDESTLVVVDEGQVSVRHKLIPSSQPKVLNAGEWIRVFKDQPLADKRLDRGGVLRTVMRAAVDALETVIYRTPRVSGPGPAPPTGGGVPGGGMPGDTGPSTPPPPPPPDGPPPPPEP